MKINLIRRFLSNQVWAIKLSFLFTVMSSKSLGIRFLLESKFLRMIWHIKSFMPLKRGNESSWHNYSKRWICFETEKIFTSESEQRPFLWPFPFFKLHRLNFLSNWWWSNSTSWEVLSHRTESEEEWKNFSNQVMVNEKLLIKNFLW